MLVIIASIPQFCFQMEQPFRPDPLNEWPRASIQSPWKRPLQPKCDLLEYEYKAWGWKLLIRVLFADIRYRKRNPPPGLVYELRGTGMGLGYTQSLKSG